jgi:hypothetical protein
VPGERMKAGREHRVPLSGAALAILMCRRSGTATSCFQAARRACLTRTWRCWPC